jgi:hypothetical protein
MGMWILVLLHGLGLVLDCQKDGLIAAICQNYPGISFDDIKPEYTSNDISYSQFLVTEKSYGEVHKQQFCFL